MSELRDEYFEFTTEEAIKEAGFCKSCKSSPCTKACPLNVNVKKILQLIREYKIKDAYEVLISKNSLADFTCHLCKERKICTNYCNTNYTEAIFNKVKADPIDIPLIENFLMNYINDNGDQILIKREKSNRQIAILGSNAAALACAFHLIFNGFNVTIYEQTNQIGNDLRTGISNIKLANEIVDNYERKLLDFGSIIEKNKNFTCNIDITKLRKEYDYLVLTENFEENEIVNISGETKCITNPLNEVMHLIMYANDFIKLPNREEYFKEDDTVIVIGNSALSFDSARIVNKFVKNITLTFSNDSKNSGISNDDILKSKLKNFKIINNIKPIKVNFVDGKVEVTFIKTKTIRDPKTGTYLEDIFDTEFTEICDHLIIDKSTGSLANSQLLKLPGISYDKNYNIIVDENGLVTSDGGVYICGELTKANSILESIKGGMDIAKTIISESGGDIQEYKDEINDIIRSQNLNMYNNLGDE